MNLYRSFGCLLESWVAEGYPRERSSSAEGLEKKLDPNGSDSRSADSLRLTGAPIRSESEDSGVELPSVVNPLTSQHSVLTSQASQLGEDDLRPVGSVGPGRPYVQPADEQRSSEAPKVTHTPQQPAVSNKEAQAACATGPEWDHLPPGFLYLEQMCRMLEEIARLQRENHNLQLVIKNGETGETEMKAVCRKKADIDSTDGETLDFRHDENKPGRSSEAFRRRSVSDTWTFIRQRSKSKARQAENFPSTHVLLEQPENPQSPVETEQRKASNSLKQKISALRWNEKSKPAKSSSSQNEKKRTFRQLFNNRRKTTRF
ncbi:hypothetical protein AMELA_G00153980 [Ameiurus melas]|uniref:DUF4657 domain-containing protein n=1 Tax=Ameiurus melas TaxID=219545 RepID=A0A7J6AIX3_AMEME|nr:hypothetical protein AMELA_G00153980 [Ameiurus melas]